MMIDRDNARELIAEVATLRPGTEWFRRGEQVIHVMHLVRELADALESALSAVPVEGDREALTELQDAFDAAGQMPQGTMTHEQWKVFARLYNAAEHVAYPLAPASLPVEGEVEWEYQVANNEEGYVSGEMTLAEATRHANMDYDRIERRTKAVPAGEWEVVPRDR